MIKTAIKRVTIELSSGAQIVMAPAWPTLPIQFVMPGALGRLGEVIEIPADNLLSILEGIRDRP